MKPSERIAQIASERYSSHVQPDGSLDPGTRWFDPCDKRAVVAYLDELHEAEDAERLHRESHEYIDRSSG